MFDRCMSIDSWRGDFGRISRKKVEQLWKLKQVLLPCPCKDLVKKKGIFVGWCLRNRSMMMFCTTKMYLQRYWIR